MGQVVNYLRLLCFVRISCFLGIANLVLFKLLDFSAFHEQRILHSKITLKGSKIQVHPQYYLIYKMIKVPFNNHALDAAIGEELVTCLM